MRKRLILSVSVACTVISLSLAQDPTALNGPYGGSVIALTANSDQIIFAGTAKGLYKSSNGGNSWSLLATEFSSSRIVSVGLKSDTVLVVGTSQGNYVSLNAGSSWSQATTGLSGATITSVISTSLGDFFAGSSIGVFRSTNNGVTWAQINSGLSNPNVRSLAVSPSDYVFATTPTGIFRTSYLDGFWTQIDSGIANTNTWGIAVSPDGYLLSGTSGNQATIYKSTDNGTYWQTVYSHPSYTSITSFAFKSDTAVAGTINGILLSTDSGASWLQKNNGLNDSYVNTVLTTSDFFAGTNTGGVFRSIDLAENWSRVNNGILKANVFSIFQTASSQFIASTQSGVFASTNNGQDWNQLGDFSTASSIQQTSSGYLFLATGACADPTVHISTNNGNSWLESSPSFPGTTILLARNDTTILAFTGGCSDSSFVAQTMTEFPAAWQKTFIGIGINFRSACLNPTNNHILGATNQGIIRSSDGGNSWTFINQGFSTNIDANTIAVNSQGNLFAASSGKLFRLTDYFVGWTQLTFPYSQLNQISIASNGDIYVAVASFVYRSTNNGDSWSQIAQVDNETVQSVLISSSDNLYLSTSDGVYAFDLNATSVEQIRPILPKEPVLYPSFPNPFNPATSIVFELNEASVTSLSIFDISGKKIATLLSEALSPGIYIAHWNANNYSSGTYFCQLRAGPFVLTRKLSLAK